MNQRQSLDETNSQKLTDAFNKVLESGDPVQSVSWQLVSKDGSRRLVESSVSLLKDPKGIPRGFGGFIRDVTQRHRAETLYRAKMAAETASRTKSEFLASMSHEIRTPLNSIIGLVDLMLSSKLSPDQREDLDVVKSSAYSLLSIINNILDFSKIEAGKLEFEQAPFSLEHFMDDALKIMGMKSHEKGLELVYRIAPGVPDRLLGDPTRLRQVLLNLVGNAIKFTDRGEVVVFVAPHSVTEYDVILNISVVDTGIGIPKEKQRSIFGAYNQGSAATERRYGGTGLGLAVSAQLVDLMGGRINVRSQPGKGSRFRFTARFIRQQNGAIHPQRIAQPDRNIPQLRGLKVLVTDDNASSRKILNEMLAILQLRPVLTSSAREAKEVLLQAQSNATPFDLLILDSDMPDTDGFSLTRWIIEQEFNDAGIIMMLTFPHLKHKPELETLGVHTSILKPLGAAELEAAILSTLGVESIEHDITAKAPPRQTRVPNRPLNILVAEDTPFNQKFIQCLLERWNHQTTVVENGQQALEILKNEIFDIVLMDVQMPEMDGLTATKEFRKWETGIRKAEGGRRNETGYNSDLKSKIQNHKSKIQRLPIIAMTAHAIKGDRKRCVEAGMDIYISKPIDTDKLFEAIETLTSSAGHSKEIVADAAIVDKMLLLRAFNGDWHFLKEIVEVFLNDYPGRMEELRRANTEGDSDLLMRSAHSLKGMLRNFQAEAAAETALKIEKMARADNFEDLQVMIERLTDRISEVDKMLRDIVTQRPQI